MIYKEKTTHNITYTYEDLLSWVKTFASRQLGISVDELNEENIVINPEDLKNIDINVIYTKETSNIKEQMHNENNFN